MFNHFREHPEQVLGDCQQGDGIGHVFGAKVKSVRADPAGNQNVRITQWYRGLRVVGAEVIIHVDGAEEVYRINGAYLPLLDIAVQPANDPQAALSVGMKYHPGAADFDVDPAADNGTIMWVGRQVSLSFATITSKPDDGREIRKKNLDLFHSKHTNLHIPKGLTAITIPRSNLL